MSHLSTVRKFNAGTVTPDNVQLPAIDIGRNAISNYLQTEDGRARVELPEEGIFGCLQAIPDAQPQVQLLTLADLYCEAEATLPQAQTTNERNMTVT